MNEYNFENPLTCCALPLKRVNVNVTLSEICMVILNLL